MLASDPTQRHAELLKNRVRKTHRHLHKRFAKAKIDAYRLYDWGIPEVRARVDYYAGHLVVAEYERAQTRDLPGYLEALGAAAAEAAQVPPERVHLKRRVTRSEGSAAGRYQRLGKGSPSIILNERDLRFEVNLDDFIDTGLFADHRETRAWLRPQLRGKSFLNLYCYTGAFTVAAAAAGASRTTSVDLSPNYLSWAERNLSHNGFAGPAHKFREADCEAFLFDAQAANQTWDVVLVDPPSFSTVGAFNAASGEFDVSAAHPRLIQAALSCLTPGGLLVFSTNHQRFEPDFGGISAAAEEITHRTVPEDFKQRGTFQKNPVHRCFAFRG